MIERGMVDGRAWDNIVRDKIDQNNRCGASAGQERGKSRTTERGIAEHETRESVMSAERQCTAERRTVDHGTSDQQ